MSESPWAGLDDGDARRRTRTRTGAGAALIVATVVGLVALAFIAGTLWEQNRPAGGAPAPARRYAGADMTVSAQELFEGYWKDKTTANLAYNGKVLEVKGEAVNSGTDKEGAYIILMAFIPHRPGPISPQQAYNRMAAAAASGVQGVRCYGPGLPKKGPVTLRGRCAGMPLDVVLRDCEAVRR